MRKFLLGNPDNASRDSYIWYSIGGMLNAGQSALLLLVISRTNPVEDAGIFSIAYAIACLALTVGNYGMRSFQATDVREKYSYSVYVNSRIITVVLMIAMVIYDIFKGYVWLDYSKEKCLIILFVSLMKAVDSIEDVVIGRFQQKGRLDIGARCMTSRYIIVLVTYAVMLCLTHNLLYSSCVAFGVSLLYFLVAVCLTYRYLNDKVEVHLIDRQILHLLGENFGLFVGGFVMLYIANAPKYAIDKYMNETVQACYNYIFMPIYVVNVLNAFIYQPILVKLARVCEEKKYKEFRKMFLRQLTIILGMSVGIIVVSAFLGVSTLSLFYNIDLSTYKSQLMLLMLGSSFLAISGYLGVVITILRKQNWLMIGYLLVAIIAWIAAEPLVISLGITGAAVSYTLNIFLLMIIFALIFHRSKKVIFKEKEHGTDIL